jgi:hypothetical protein
VIVVADASVLVGELLRKRGRELLLHPDLRVLVAEHQWERPSTIYLGAWASWNLRGGLRPSSGSLWSGPWVIWSTPGRS